MNDSMHLKKNKKIILASGSAIRNRLLTDAGLRFRAAPVDLDESSAYESHRAAGGADDAAAEALAKAKALAVADAGADVAVIGADQILMIEGAIQWKCRTRAEAIDRLRRLNGGRHRLISGVAIAIDGQIVWSASDSVDVTMRENSEAFLRSYVVERGDDLLNSVTCYEIEAFGPNIIENIAGDYFSALGLPMFPLIGALKHLGYLEI